MQQADTTVVWITSDFDLFLWVAMAGETWLSRAVISQLHVFETGLCYLDCISVASIVAALHLSQ